MVNIDSGLWTKLSEGTKIDAHICPSTYSVPLFRVRAQQGTLLCCSWFQMSFLVLKDCSCRQTCKCKIQRPFLLCVSETLDTILWCILFSFLMLFLLTTSALRNDSGQLPVLCLQFRMYSASATSGWLKHFSTCYWFTCAF